VWEVAAELAATVAVRPNTLDKVKIASNNTGAGGGDQRPEAVGDEVLLFNWSGSRKIGTD
jgi:hypothetical protein